MQDRRFQQYRSAQQQSVAEVEAENPQCLVAGVPSGLAADALWLGPQQDAPPGAASGRSRRLRQQDAEKSFDTQELQGCKNTLESLVSDQTTRVINLLSGCSHLQQ